MKNHNKLTNDYDMIMNGYQNTMNVIGHNNKWP